MKKIVPILHKWIIVVLAIQLLNMSFNNMNNFYADDLSSLSTHNKIDSGYEFITEHLFGWDNHIPENGPANNHPSNHFHKTAGFCCMDLNFLKIEIPVLPFKPAYQLQTIPTAPTGFIGDINPPPPKAIV